MSKGSGSTRATNSATAHGGGKSNYVSPTLSNGKSASELTDEQIAYRTNMSNERKFSADQEALKIEAKHRVNIELKQRIKNFDKDIKAYKDAESAFISEFKKDVMGLQFSPLDNKPQFFGSAKKDKDRQNAFKDAQRHVKELKDKALSSPTLINFADDKIFNKWWDLVRVHRKASIEQRQ